MAYTEPSPNSKAEAAARNAGGTASRALYAELRRLARRQLGASPRATLCTTVLVHEAWLKLGEPRASAMQRNAFLAMAARTMRNVLIDYLRERGAAKRGGGAHPVTLDTSAALADHHRDDVDLLTIEQALQLLERLEPRLVSVTECHFFAGMDFAEIGSVLGLSERSVQRDWRRARAFLQAQLADLRP
jgi:RNA polymerase sigma factor (TIGR02999 family)